MNNRRVSSQAKPTSPRNNLSGVLETIAAGLSLVLARPYLVVLPLLIDLTTWLGFQVSARPLIEPLRRLMIEQGGSSGPAAAKQLGTLSERLRVNDVVAMLTPSIFAGVPKDTILSVLVTFLAPPLTEGIDREEMYDSWGNGLIEVWDPGDWLSIAGISILLFGLATILIVLFRVPIARAVRGDSGSIVCFLRECAIAWARLVTLLIIFVTVAAVIVGPLLVGAAILLVLGVNLSALLALAVFIFGGLAALYTVFVLDAMFISRLGPIASLKMSFAVVKSHFGPTARFAGASLILATGALQIWSTIVQNTPGIFIALIGNAVLGTGLSVASMMFFQDRFQVLSDPLSQRTIPSAKWRRNR